jgi:hypothetical protein
MLTLLASCWMSFGATALAGDGIEENGGFVVFFTDYSLLIKDGCETTVVYIATEDSITQAVDDYLDETEPVTFRVKGSRVDMHLEPRGKLMDRLEGFETVSHRRVLVVTEAYAEKHGLFDLVIAWN